MNLILFGCTLRKLLSRRESFTYQCVFDMPRYKWQGLEGTANISMQDYARMSEVRLRVFRCVFCYQMMNVLLLSCTPCKCGMSRIKWNLRSRRASRYLWAPQASSTTRLSMFSLCMRSLESGQQIRASQIVLSLPRIKTRVDFIRGRG